MIFVVAPVYNEEKNLDSLIKKLQSIFQGKDYKIVFVNDGSSDNSLPILKSAQSPHLLVETYSLNQNVGVAFLTGINRVLAESVSDDDVLIIMESDQTSEVGLIDNLVAEIATNHSDIAIASRYKKGGGYQNFPMNRWLLSNGANRLMRMIFHIKGIDDYTIFYRAYRVGLLRTAERYFGKQGLIRSEGFPANVELLVKLSLLTNRIAEVPFVYNYGKKIGKSKIKILKTISEYSRLVSSLKKIQSKFKKGVVS